MKKFEAKTLEETYRIACDQFGCSLGELKYEIVQYPSGGIFGLFSKPAIIVAMHEKPITPEAEPVAAAKDREATTLRPVTETKKEPTREERKKAEDLKESTKKNESVRQKKSIAPDHAAQAESVPPKRESGGSHEEILERFFDDTHGTEAEEARSEHALQTEIEATLKELMAQSCFDIDTIEVDVIDNTAYIFMDGDDAALLIGKEGYRYNALSYLLFNWIHSQYKLYIKLEVAQFLSSQEEMIRHTLRPVIEHVEREGWGRTRPLDGILAQIALEQLREAFPGKYVAIKRQRDGGRYILINEFNKHR